MYPKFFLQPCNGPCYPGHIKSPQELFCLAFQGLVPKLLPLSGYICKEFPHGHAPVILAALNLQSLASLTGNGYMMSRQPYRCLAGSFFSIQPANEKPFLQFHLLYASLLQQEFQYLEMLVCAIQLHLVHIIPCLLCRVPVLVLYKAHAFVALRDNLSQPIFFQEASQLLQVISDSLKGTIHICRQTLHSHKSI